MQRRLLEILSLSFTLFFSNAFAQEGARNQRLVSGSGDLFNWIFDVNADDLKKVPPASQTEVKPYFPKGFFQTGVFDVEISPASYAGDQFGEWKPDQSLQYQATLFSENAVRGGAPLNPCFTTLGALNQVLNPPGKEKNLYLSVRHLSQKKTVKVSTGANVPNIFQRLFVRPDDAVQASEPKLKAGEPFMSVLQVPEPISGRYTSSIDLQKRGLASAQKILESFDFCASKIQADKIDLQRWQKLGPPLPALRRQVVDLLQISASDGARKH